MRVAEQTWSTPRWLQRWSLFTLALVFTLLALGAVVTSFAVGMADPVWPTRPWHLFTIDWKEPNAGFLIEHIHRLAGFAVGAAVSILAFGSWMTEPDKKLRWAGGTAIVALLVAFGQLHGSLIRQQKLLLEMGQLSDKINWIEAVGPTLVALSFLFSVVSWELVSGTNGRGIRSLGVFLLILVMLQGLLGGLRVYLNALAGTDLAAIHGSFAQIVVATLVTIVVLTFPRDLPSPSPGLAGLSLGTTLFLFGQVIAGAFLRHTTSSIAARLHLLGAFASMALMILLARRLKGPGVSPVVQVFRVFLHALIGLQIIVGVEAWLMRFGGGLAAAQWRPITVADASVRTIHSLIGYALLATSVALTVTLKRAAFVKSHSAPRPRKLNETSILETVS